MGLFSMFGPSGSDAATTAAGQLAGAAQQAGQVESDYGERALGLLNQSMLTSRGDLINNYNTAVGELNPYKNVGLNALDQLADSSGTSRPVMGSLNSGVLNEYNSLIARINQLSQSANQNESFFRTTQGTPNLKEREDAQAQVSSSQLQLDQLRNQVQNLISSAPSNLKDQLTQHYQQTNQYLDAQHNNALYNILNTPTGGDAGTHLGSVADQLKFEQQAVPTGLMDVQAPAALGTDMQMTNTAGGPTTNPLTGFSNSGEAAVIGGYDPNKSFTDNFHTDPGYQFSLDQGRQQLEKSAASQGLLESGTFTKGLNDYGQGMADQQYGNYINRLTTQFGNYKNGLLSLTNLGNQASTNIANASLGQGQNLVGVNTNYGNNGAAVNQNIGTSLANSLLAQGAANAGGTINAYNSNAANSQANSQLGSYFGSLLTQDPKNKNGGSGGGGDVNLQGAASGASTGAAAGPYGALAGGIIGGLFY
jgi:hypothetical protein